MMSEAIVLGSGEAARVWGPMAGSVGSRRAGPMRYLADRSMSFNAWLSAEEVALLILRGECLDAGISVPAKFSAQALESALGSVERWTREGRIFAIHELYPRYQFDGRGRPLAPIERALAVFGRTEVLRVGNWFAAANPHLGGKRPQELLTTAPAFVAMALQIVVATAAS